MNKVIIDGVNVAGCKYYIDADNDDLCSKQSTGYDLHYVKCANNPYCYYKNLKRKEQENKRLKEELRTAQMNRITMFEKLDIVNEKDTYKQALQEIKEICKNSHTSASEDFFRTADKIQAKINEVIGAE